MASIILSQLGFDPFALFLSMSSIILAFAFMIGSASAKYFEGLLFILVQRPCEYRYVSQIGVCLPLANIFFLHQTILATESTLNPPTAQASLLDRFPG